MRERGMIVRKGATNVHCVNFQLQWSTVQTDMNVQTENEA